MSGILIGKCFIGIVRGGKEINTKSARIKNKNVRPDKS
jgi:hypothetical protein